MQQKQSGWVVLRKECGKGEGEVPKRQKKERRICSYYRSTSLAVDI
jgi:hypothetical protein